MPGLAAIIGTEPGEARRELETMLASLQGPDPQPVRRLALDRLGLFAGCVGQVEPEAGGTGAGRAADVAVIFHGQDFSALRPDELYQRLGEDFPAALNGFFHGLLVDARAGRAILFNDRFGLRRLYWHEGPGGLYVATEAKAILAVRPELRRFDPPGLGEWLSCGAVLEDRTLFAGIRALPAGSVWTFGPDGSRTRRSYFSPAAWESADKLDQAEFFDRLGRVFPEVLARYLDPHGPTGLSVTGGIDTRLILAHLGDRRSDVRCYSFCGPRRESLDVTIGRKAARIAGCPHTTLRIGPDFFERFEDLARAVVERTDGNLDLTGAPNLYMCRLARDISPVRLTGNYGSEVLRRTRTFGPNPSISGVLSPGGRALVEEAGRRWPGVMGGPALTSIVFRQIPWYSYNRLQLEESATIMRSPFLDNDLLELIYRAPAAIEDWTGLSLRLIAAGDPRLGALPTDRGLTWPRRPGGGLVHAYYELMFRLEYLASHGMPKRLAGLDRRLGPFGLEGLFLGRNKYYHLRQWFRDELAGFVRRIALDPRTLRRDYLDGPAVRAAVEKHLAGVENHTQAINKIITLELANEIILKGAS
ncbi:MAG TPA: asparagine synthase-related protein [Candidatus Aminicenantes bacterium]|nr:asparagine synthase-related protein [Candidatus Aminicenantes bacterium]HRY64884.1 asparagine synthase-related protein [Candidatus Aminicenantes bacterium]HRZ71797.1 asparagine synthase-related protein [Candidatus Aminicenantes bacterium]